MKRMKRWFGLPFRDFRLGIKNLITWFPIIWNDHQWDQVYIYIMLHKKLVLMQKFYEEGNTYCIKAPVTLKEIKICKFALERLIKDDYLPDSFLAEKDRTKARNMCALAEVRHKQDIEILVNTMRKHIRTWWD